MRGETLEPLVYLTTKLRSLDGKLTVDQARRLVALPRELGFANSEEFLAAFRRAIGAEATETSTHDSAVDEQPAGESSMAGDLELKADEQMESVEPVSSDESSDESSASAAGIAPEEVNRTSEEDPSGLPAEDRLATAEGDAEETSGEESATSTASDRDTAESDLNARVRSMVEAGKTRAVIAGELGISVTQVQKIKKTLGLAKKPTPRSSVSKAKSSRRRGKGSPEAGE